MIDYETSVEFSEKCFALEFGSGFYFANLTMFFVNKMLFILISLIDVDKSPVKGIKISKDFPKNWIFHKKITFSWKGASVCKDLEFNFKNLTRYNFKLKNTYMKVYFFERFYLFQENTMTFSSSANKSKNREKKCNFN